MALYTKDSIDRVKEAVDMVELVGARTDLRRVGTRHTGLCPFHDERTPSFSVNAEHRLYHCFGCGASGDAIGFVQATEAVDFREAVEGLAERYGVELRREEEDPREEERRRRRERLLSLLERTAAYYARVLWESGEARRAREYLASRGLEEQVLRDFRVGYAPSALDRVIAGAMGDGFRPEEVAAAGLASRGDGGRLYDRFRSRIMFPLADARGRVLGFGARASREAQRPKYLNSSEGEIYHKGRQLFGIDRARAPAARAGRVIVTEGYTDVLALHQAGVPESVAIMGTALTPEQLAELGRAASTIMLALDADRAGREAMLRAARSGEERGVELLVVAMAEGRDPAEMVAGEGVEAFHALLDEALSVPEFAVRGILAGADLESPRGRDRALVELRPLVASTPERSALRDHLVALVADRLDVPPGYLGAGAAGIASRAPAVPTRAERAGEVRPAGAAPEGAAQPAGGATSPLDAALRAERSFLAMCVAEPATGRGLLGRLSDDHLSSAALRRVRDHLLAHSEDPLASRPVEDPATAALITEVVMLADEEPASEPALKLGFLQLELRRIERALRHAGEARDYERQRELYSAREGVRAELDEVMGEAA